MNSGLTMTSSPAATLAGTKTAPQGRTASGEAVGCDWYYTVQSCDFCINFATTYEMSFAIIYAWNPSSTFMSIAPPGIEFLEWKLTYFTAGHHDTVTHIAPLRAATRVRRLGHSMTIRLRRCIRGL